MANLYEDQQEFIHEIRKLWKEHKRIVGLAPTGFGKTVVASHIINGCVNAGWRVMFVVPRISLIEQTERSFRKNGITDITRIWTGHDFKSSAKVIIASADTLSRRERFPVDLTIIDECHLRKRKILEWMTEFKDDRYLGLSGTPYAPWIGEYYTALAKAKDMRWLIDHGRLSDYEVFAPSSPDLSGLTVKKGFDGYDYVESELATVMSDAKLVGDIVSNWLEHGENRLTMALCVNVAHANQICIEFNRNGVQAEVVTAKTKIEEREQIFQRMRDGVTRVVTSVNALTEGLDVPEIACVINARPTKSEARFIQGMGRGLRVAKGKKNCLIFDHAGTVFDLGMPEDISIDELNTGDDGMSEAAKRFLDDKPEKKPKVCPQCKFMKPAGMYVCVKCGFKPMMGQDVETDTSRGLARLSDTPRVTKRDKQFFFSELLGFMREKAATGRPMKDGWAAVQFRNKFGEWPNGLQKVARPVSMTTRNYIKSQFVRYAKAKEKANAHG